MYRIKCELNIRGNDWGVSLSAGRVVSPAEDLGDGKTIGDLIADECISTDHFEELSLPAAAPIVADEDEF